MLAYHPKESGRLEFKSLDMPTDRRDFHSFFLLWLWLVADTKAPGQADDQDRIYDLGALARLGWEAEQITGRAEEVLDRSEVVLAGLGLDPSPLGQLRQRLARRWVPADALIRQVEADPSVSNLLRYLDAIAATRDVPQLACEDLSSGNGRSESHWDIDEESTHEVDYAREGEGGPGRLSLAHQEVRGHRR
jgi:hypothetical protein